jgi:hypothetical protein
MLFVGGTGGLNLGMRTTGKQGSASWKESLCCRRILLVIKEL